MTRDRRAIWAACILPFTIVAGALWSAHEAHADPVDNYTRIEAGVVCNALTAEPTLNTVSNLFSAIARDTSFTIEQAAKVVTSSVAVYCPENQYVLDRFVAVYAEAPLVAIGAVSGSVGGRLGA